MIDPTILLKDTFDNGDLAAGSVNGTLASDGASTRTVVDTSSYLSISGGKVVNSSTKSSDIDPAMWQTIGVPVATGVVFAWRLNRTASGYIRFGTATAVGGIARSGFYLDPGNLCSNVNNLPLLTISSTFTTKTFAYAVGVSNRRFLFSDYTGVFLLHYIHPAGNSAEQYQMLGTYGGLYELDEMKCAGYWLPTPLLSDGFGSAFGTSDGLGHAEGIATGIGAGGGGKSWSGANWSNSAGKTINTPTLGSNVVVNGTFDTDSDWTKGTGWTISGGVANASVTGFANLSQNALTLGKLYRVSISAALASGTLVAYVGNNGSISASISIVSGTNIATRRSEGTPLYIRGNPSCVGTIDNVTVEEISTSDSLCLSDIGADIYCGVDLIVASGFQAGIALNWNSDVSPTSGVIVYRDSLTNISTYKCVSGTWTFVSSTSVAYSAGARLVVSKVGSAYRVYYNNALVVATTISDAAIVNNTLHGLFSTDASNQLDNYVAYASGSGGEYNDDLTLTFSKNATSTVTLAGARLKSISKNVSGAVTLAGARLKGVQKISSSVVALASVQLKSVSKSATSAVTLASVQIKSVSKNVSSTVTLASASVSRHGRAIIRVIRLLGRIDNGY